MSLGSTRREFLEASLRAGMAWPVTRLLGAAAPMPPSATPERVRSHLRRFPDLARHFVFEYYPWYSSDPVLHWDQWDRLPPDDIASRHYPRLGPYDSLSPSVLERHARWIVESGAGAVNLSWWGPGSFEDRAVHRVMDAMRDHGLKVAFHLEPYADDRGLAFAGDVLYLVREYGEKRGWDALLVLKDADGSEGPVFKGFACILPAEVVDCHGARRPVSNHTPDGVWFRQLTEIRRALRREFDHVTLLADSLDFPRTWRSGFDGIAIYDNFLPPLDYARYAAQASERGLVFSFNVNPGFDGIEPRAIEPDSCYQPLPFAPPTPGLDWSKPEDRERAAGRSVDRIQESLAATLAAQTDPGLANARRGFFLVYVTSFNEWHEGHAFEPMRDEAELTPAQKAFGYHNPARGDYRLETLRMLLRDVLSPVATAGAPGRFLGRFDPRHAVRYRWESPSL